MDSTQEILELGRRWAHAEQAGDTAALDAMATDDFRLVGPAGFVLDKAQWLDRYRTGSLVMHRLAWEQVAVREYGSAAVAIGIHNQRGAYQGRAVEGRFRATHIFTRDGTGATARWRFVSQHLSPLAQPPAQAAQPPAQPAQPPAQPAQAAQPPAQPAQPPAQPAQPPAQAAQPPEHGIHAGGAR